MDTAMTNAAEPPHHYTSAQRVGLAFAYVLHVFAHLHLADAVEATWPTDGGAIPSGAVKHCKKWFERLKEEGCVSDHPRRLEWRKLPAAEAVEAAALVKRGILVPVERARGERFTQHVWFHSIDDAVRHVPRLQEILQKFEITPEHLLHRMHEEDRTLHWGKLDMKGILTDEQKFERQRYAANLLALIQADPHLLDRFVWLDEVKIWLFNGNAPNVHVWRDAYDEAVHFVVPGCGKVGGKPMRVCMYVAVNAKVGLVGFQYTHPTTGFPERWTQQAYPGAPGAEGRVDPDYKVGVGRGRGVNTMLPKQSTSVVGVSADVCMRSSTSHRKAQGSLSPFIAAYRLGWNAGVSTRMGSAGASMRACRARKSAALAAAEPTSQSRTRTSATPAPHAAAIIAASIVRCCFGSGTRVDAHTK